MTYLDSLDSDPVNREAEVLLMSGIGFHTDRVKKQKKLNKTKKTKHKHIIIVHREGATVPRPYRGTVQTQTGC